MFVEGLFRPGGALSVGDKDPAEIVCAACGKPIDRTEGRYSLQDKDYHPDCYDRERKKDSTEPDSSTSRRNPA
jgi:hypothetical protein